jgi:general secretion pathway protein I
VTRRGFTLLEVMVAVTILGLGLTLILSSQAGLFASTKRVQDDTIAANLLRCKMGEVEVELETKGFQLLDQHDSGECCEDEDTPGFSCDWRIETIELPLPTDVLNPEGDEEGEEGEDGENGKNESGSGGGKAVSRPSGNADSTTEDDADPPSKPSAVGSELGAPASPLGPLAIMAGLKGSDKLIPAGSGPEGLATALGDSSKGGPQGMVSMAMNLVYPTLKPMLEASIRKVTVSVKWQDGEKARDLTAVQYVTNPMEGSLSPTAALGLDDPSLIPGSGSGTTGTQTTPSRSTQGVPP